MERRAAFLACFLRIFFSSGTTRVYIAVLHFLSVSADRSPTARQYSTASSNVSRVLRSLAVAPFRVV